MFWEVLITCGDTLSWCDFWGDESDVKSKPEVAVVVSGSWQDDRLQERSNFYAVTTMVESSRNKLTKTIIQGDPWAEEISEKARNQVV